MNRLAIALFIAYITTLSAVASAYDYPVAIHRGNGLANTFAKLNSGQSATIGYFGGSITQNPGWRDNVTQWFNSKYPGKITEVNAGWSGTGSLIAAMRLNRDLLTRNPDLVFVEYAVNDLPEDPLAFVERNYDGIVRQTWSSSTWKDLCFIETIAPYIEQPYLNGYYPTSVQAHFNIADYYGIPSVNVGWALYKLVMAGTPWETFAPDRVHPNATGSKVYSDAVIAYLESERTRAGTASAHNLPTAKTSFPVIGSNIRDMATVSPMPSGWSAHYNEFGVSSFAQSSIVGSTITVTFTGPAAAAKVVVAGDSGEIQYSIDGGAYANANIPVNGYYFLWAFPVAKTLTNASHTVTFKVASGVARIINVEAATTSAVGMIDAVPSGANIAPQSIRWYTDSDSDISHKGSKSIDTQTTTYWKSGNSSLTHWLTLDLGGNRSINGFIVRHASSAGEPASYNTRSFRIQSATSLSGPWSDECSVDNNAQLSTTNRSYTVPKTLRYIRLYITNPGPDNYARIPEFQVHGTSDGMNDDTPIGTNHARQAVQYQTDSNYGPDWTGAKAIDGVINGSSKWTSTNTSSTHWLALDLGANKVINGFIVRHAGAGGEDSYYNTKAFKIQSATSMSGPWVDECVVDNSAQASVTTRSYNLPKTLRYVRLYITNSGIDNYARIPEFEVWGSTVSAVSSLKLLPTGTQVSMSGQVVTGVFSDCFFIEQWDRASGVRCVKSGATLSAGDKVNVTGTVGTMNGEKVLNSAGYSFLGMTEPLEPIGFAGRSAVSVLPSPIGLYSTIWGKVTKTGSGYFVIDDGSGVQSSRGVVGIEVNSSASVTLDSFVSASGILCIELVNGQPEKVLRAVAGGVKIY